jgi:uncharacterized protein YlaI
LFDDLIIIIKTISFHLFNKIFQIFHKFSQIFLVNNQIKNNKNFVNSPGCLKCECESRDDFPTLTVASEFVEYPVEKKKKMKFLHFAIDFSSIKIYIFWDHTKRIRQKSEQRLKNHTSLVPLRVFHFSFHHFYRFLK